MGSTAIDTTPGNEYKLTRGGREKIRLTSQHHTMVSRQGWLLHPTVAEAIKDIAKPRIADVATGTGIWALDLAASMPHAELVGLDITDQQFYASWTLPANVQFKLYDLLEEVPQELQGQFDVVHVRLLLAAGPAVDPMIFVNRFKKLLRPGGWLQWDELTWPNMYACYHSSSQKFEVVNIEQHPMMQAKAKYLRFHKTLGWINQFEKAVTEGGEFDSAQMNAVPVRPYLLQIESDLCVATMEEFVNTLIINKGITDSTIKEELQNALAALYADVDKGALFLYGWTVSIARRT